MLSAETSYVCLAGFFGTLFLVLTPPFQAPDEGNHFLRAYQITEGQIIGTRQGDTSGGIVPSAVLAETHQFDDLPFHLNARTSARAIVTRLTASPRFGSPAMSARSFGEFPNTVRYSPIPYLPQVAAIGIARALGTTIVAALYLCRAFSLALAIGATWISIKLLPESLRWSFAALALLPMGLFISAMASTDALIISLSYLTFSLAVWLRAHPQASLTPGVMLVIGCCLVGLTLSKVAYFLVPAALAIGLFSRVTSTTGRAALLAATVVLSLVLDVGWVACVEGIRTPPRRDSGIDSAAQLRLVLNDPMVFVRAATFDVSRRFVHYFDSFIGKLGYLDVVLSRWIINAFTAFVVLLGVTRTRGEPASPFSRIERGLLLAIPVLTVILTVFLQYLDWVTVGGKDLRGVLQGRHYYPVAAALLIAAPRLSLPDRWASVRPLAFTGGYAGLLAASVAELLHRYYL